jgi:hypothetical protein
MLRLTQQCVPDELGTDGKKNDMTEKFKNFWNILVVPKAARADIERFRENMRKKSVRKVLARRELRLHGRGLHSSTSHLNLSRFWSLKPQQASTSHLILRRFWSLKPQQPSTSHLNLRRSWSLKPQQASTSQLNLRRFLCLCDL